MHRDVVPPRLRRDHPPPPQDAYGPVWGHVFLLVLLIFLIILAMVSVSGCSDPPSPSPTSIIEAAGALGPNASEEVKDAAADAIDKVVDRATDDPSLWVLVPISSVGCLMCLTGAACGFFTGWSRGWTMLLAGLGINMSLFVLIKTSNQTWFMVSLGVLALLWLANQMWSTARINRLKKVNNSNQYNFQKPFWKRLKEGLVP